MPALEAQAQVNPRVSRFYALRAGMFIGAGDF